MIFGHICICRGSSCLMFTACLSLSSPASPLRSSGPSHVSSSPPGSPSPLTWDPGTLLGSAPHHLGPHPLPPPSSPGSRSDVGTVPGLPVGERALWCACAAETPLWTGRWGTQIEGAPCRTNGAHSPSHLSVGTVLESVLLKLWTI